MAQVAGRTLLCSLAAVNGAPCLRLTNKLYQCEKASCHTHWREKVFCCSPSRLSLIFLYNSTAADRHRRAQQPPQPFPPAHVVSVANSVRWWMVELLDCSGAQSQWPLSTHLKTRELLNSAQWWNFCICAFESWNSHLHIVNGAWYISAMCAYQCFSCVLPPSSMYSLARPPWFCFDKEKRHKSVLFFWLTFMCFFPSRDVCNCCSH